MKVSQDGKTYDAAIIGSVNVNPGYKLVGNAAYPQMAEDYEKTFDVLKSLPCDLFLAAHGDVFNLEGKCATQKRRRVRARRSRRLQKICGRKGASFSPGAREARKGSRRRTVGARGEFFQNSTNPLTTP